MNSFLLSCHNFPQLSLIKLLQSHAHLSMLQTSKGFFILTDIYNSLGNSFESNSIAQVYILCLQKACSLFEIQPNYYQMIPTIVFNQMYFLDSLLVFLESLISWNSNDLSPIFQEFRKEIIDILSSMRNQTTTSINNQYQPYRPMIPVSYYPVPVVPVNINHHSISEIKHNSLQPKPFLLPPRQLTPVASFIPEQISSVKPYNQNSNQFLPRENIVSVSNSLEATDILIQKTGDFERNQEDEDHLSQSSSLQTTNDKSDMLEVRADIEPSQSSPLNESKPTKKGRLNNFIAHIRKSGVDFIFPLSLQDIVLACVYAILNIYKCYNIKDIIEYLVILQNSNLFPELQSISKSKMRGLVAMLRHSQIIILESLNEIEINELKMKNIHRNIRLNLSKDINSLKLLRQKYDDYIVNYQQLNQLELTKEDHKHIIWDESNCDESYYHSLEIIIEKSITFFQENQKNCNTIQSSIFHLSQENMI